MTMYNIYQYIILVSLGQGVNQYGILFRYMREKMLRRINQKCCQQMTIFTQILFTSKNPKVWPAKMWPTVSLTDFPSP